MNMEKKRQLLELANNRVPLSQRAIAVLCDTNPTSVAKYERRALVKIKEALDKIEEGIMPIAYPLPRQNYARVSRSRPCPVCNKPDWCLIARDGSHAICARVSLGGVYCGEPGYKHQLTNQRAVTPSPMMRDRVDFDASGYAQRFERAITPAQLELTAHELGVSSYSLQRLRMGWCAEHDAPAFPMWLRGDICGIRIRKDGAKFCIVDSRNGFFLPRGLSDAIDTLYVVEGPTDTAAALDLGLDAIGKPNASACTDELIRILQSKQPELTVFMGENDRPDSRGKAAGIDGPLAQCKRAVASGLNAVFVLPPRGKDLREWKNAHGATRGMIEKIVENARG